MSSLAQRKIDQIKRGLLRKTQGLNPQSKRSIWERFAPCRCNGKVFATDGVLMFAARSKAKLPHCNTKPVVSGGADLCIAIDDVDRSIDEKPIEVDLVKLRARLQNETLIDIGKGWTAPRFDAKLVGKLLVGIPGRARVALVTRGIGANRPVLGFQATNGEWTAAVAGVSKGISKATDLDLHEFGRRR